MTDVPSRPMSAPPREDHDSPEDWTVVVHSKAHPPKAPKSHHQPSSHGTQHGTGRRKSQPDVNSSLPASVTSSASNSRRTSLTQQQQQAQIEFASFRARGGGANSRAQTGDWRRGTPQGSEPSTPPNELASHTVASGALPSQSADSSPKKLPKAPKPQKAKAVNLNPKSLPPRSTRSPSPIQPHIVIHQIGHSRFSLGPTDFPNLVFRRVMWQTERNMVANTTTMTSANDTQITEIEVTAETTQIEADAMAADETGPLSSESDSHDDGVLVQHPEVASHREEEEVVADEESVAEVTPIPAPIEIASSVDVAAAIIDSVIESALTAEMTPVASDDQSTTPIALVEPILSPKKKKKKKTAPAVTLPAPVDVTEPAEVESPPSPIHSHDEPTCIPAISNYRPVALQVACSLISLLALLASILPSSRFFTVPLVFLLIGIVAAVHHPIVEAKLPIEFQPSSSASASALHRAQPLSNDNLALLSHIKKGKSSQSKKKGNKSKGRR